MKIVSVLSAKGGVGKSTVSLLLSACLSKKYKTALLDCDIQSTCVSAKEINPDLPFEIVSAPHLKEIMSQGQRIETDGVEWLIVDTNPRSFLENPQQIDEILNLSDLCLLVIKPCPKDVRANVELARRIVSKRIVARILWNFVQPRICAHKASMEQAPKLLVLEPLKTSIQLRACYSDTFDEKPLPVGNKDAEKEINGLLKEIKGLVK